MKKSSVMRPQDIVILLKLVAIRDAEKRMIDLANELFISLSEVSESLNRSYISGLIGSNKRDVHRKAFLEFLIYGIRYVFPQYPGAIVRGMPTAHSASPMKEKISSHAGEYFVWEDVDGEVRGQKIEPLFISVPKAARIDHDLYELLTLVDSLRVGQPREIAVAQHLLKERFH